ncbi:MAG: nucleotide excision repair endonuclease [Prosthecobacter sp.]|nr:nucleotide excision repair endonuclease [Prosthecobacter sp.]
MAASSETEEPVPRHRQMRLLEIGNPLAARLGAAFFQSLPRQPGVYFFYDTHGRLLYIGQSNDLRARVGSYRHVCPERHPRRTLRLVQRIARIEFRLCATPAEAQQCEAALLLEHRPPFNRAGVWQAPPWWLTLDLTADTMSVRLARAPSLAESSHGPLDSSFRYIHATLMRCLLRSLNPGLSLAAFPMGLLNPAAPLALRLPLPAEHHHLAPLLSAFATRTSDEILTNFEIALTPASIPGLLEQAFWAEQLESLRKYYHKKPPLAGISPVQQAAEPAGFAAFPALDLG